MGEQRGEPEIAGLVAQLVSRSWNCLRQGTPRGVRCRPERYDDELIRKREPEEGKTGEVDRCVCECVD